MTSNHNKLGYQTVHKSTSYGHFSPRIDKDALRNRSDTTSSSTLSSISSLSYSRSTEFDVLDDFQLRDRYIDLLGKLNDCDVSVKETIQKIKNLITEKGIPESTEEERKRLNQHATLRGRLWQVILGVTDVDAEEYISYVKKGPSKFHRKLMMDVPRTLGGRDKEEESEVFEAVTYGKLVRVINALFHSIGDKNSKIAYVQGMNNVLTPFLCEMPEVEAFFAFKRFVTVHCPTYFYENVAGVFRGLDLFLSIFLKLDSELCKFLDVEEKIHKMYAFRHLISFNTFVPTMQETIKLWDFLLANGPHLNVICVIAQVILLRDELFKQGPKARNLLQERAWPRLNAKLLISKTRELTMKIQSENVYESLEQHMVSLTTLPKSSTISGRRFVKSRGRINEW